MSTRSSASEARGLRRSLTEKLKNEARRRGVVPDVIRKQYIFTIFLRRLFTADTGQWMLLGGNALLIRTGGGRFTQDIDLARRAEWEKAEDVRDELASLVCGPREVDPFEFVLSRITGRNDFDDQGYGVLSARVGVVAYLGSKPFESFSIDVVPQRHVEGLVDSVPLVAVIEHDTLRDLPAVATVSVESHLADKICAMYQSYKNGASTRYRDLADIVRIVRQLSFDAQRLTQVLDREARRRRMRLPTVMKAPDETWVRRYRQAAADFAQLPTQFHDVENALAFVGACLNDVLSRSRCEGVWDPGQQHWT